MSLSSLVSKIVRSLQITLLCCFQREELVLSGNKRQSVRPLLEFRKWQLRGPHPVPNPATSKPLHQRQFPRSSATAKVGLMLAARILMALHAPLARSVEG